MNYLFSYDNQIYIKCQEIHMKNKVVARLIKLDSNLHPTNEYVDIERALACIFLKRCEGFVLKKPLTYQGLGYSDERINTTRIKVNEAFRVLGFPSDCYSGSELCPMVSCAPLRIAEENEEPIYSSAEQLFNQEIVFDGSKKRLSILSPDLFKRIFPSKEQPHCIFLYGEGGSGKSNFLKLIENQGKSRSNQIYYCSLSDLLDDALLHPIQSYLHCGKDILRAGTFENGFTSHLFRYCGIQQYRSVQKYIFLLDGLNEMLDRNTNRTYGCIQQILTEIAMIHNAEIRIIISSRNVRDTTYLPFSDRIFSATLTDVLDQNDILKAAGTDEIRKLLGKPLFMQFYRRLIHHHKALPKTAFEIWNAFHIEACKQEYMKKNISKDSALYTYYILLPLFAYHMETDNANNQKLTRFQVLRLMEQLNHSAIARERSEYVINQMVNSISSTRFHLSQVPVLPFYSLQNLETFVSYDEQSDSIKFRHQTIREYFSAFYIVWFLKSLKTVPSELRFVPNFNLNASIREMVLSALRFEPQNRTSNGNNKSERMNSNHNERYAQLFQISESLSARTNLEELHAQIQHNLSLTYIAHDFSDRFFLLVDQERYQIMAPFCESLMQSGRFLQDYPEVLSEIERNVLLQVYATVMYHFRNEHDYGKCREIYEFCRQSIIVSEKNRYAMKLEHQRAKALLCCCQDIYTGLNMKSHYYNKPDLNDPAAMFRDAVKILEKCLPFNLSVNTLAHLYMYPVYWIKENNLIQRNLLTAFQIYRLIYDESNNQHYLYSQNGSDLYYTCRQMAGLLIKGYLRIKNGELIPSSESPLISKDDCRETMEYAEKILSHIDGHDYKNTDWLRGAIQLYKGNTTEAKQYFMSAPDYLLTKILYLINGWSTNEEALVFSIQEEIRKKKEQINRTPAYENTDDCYLLDEVRMLGYHC